MHDSSRPSAHASVNRWTQARSQGIRCLPAGIGLCDWQLAFSLSPLFRHRHWAELVALYVAPLLRGMGLADRLLAQGVRWARESGYASVQLYVTATNLRAKRFYARVGFRPVQEIWCVEIDSARGIPPEDPECEAAYAQGHHLLSTTHHPVVLDDACLEAGDAGERSEPPTRSTTCSGTDGLVDGPLPPP